MLDLEEKLNGLKYTKQDIRMAIENEQIEKYFGSISIEEFIELLFQ